MRRHYELRALARDLAAAPPVDKECQRLLNQLRRRCPGVIPPDPLPAGKVGGEIPLPREAVQRLVTTVATGDGKPAVLWTKDDSELLVFAAKIKVALDDGIVLFTIPVRCDEIGDAMTEVALAVGDEKRPAGMLAATEDRPRGPDAIVDVWGEELIAFGWQILLTLTTAIADTSGTDEDGAGLVPAAVTASPGGVNVLTMARHPFDRVKR